MPMVMTMVLMMTVVLPFMMLREMLPMSWMLLMMMPVMRSVMVPVLDIYSIDHGY